MPKPLLALLALSEPALEAIRKWRFRPARKDGTPVATRVRQTLVFSFAGETAEPKARRRR